MWQILGGDGNLVRRAARAILFPIYFQNAS
jgi:hypothetical protein